MTFSLRPYQQDIIDETRTALRTSSSVLIQSATGSGKTNLATYMIGRATERGRRAWFVCHRDFLLTQTAATFDQIGVPYGYIAAGREFNPYRQVQIASIDTLRRRLDRLTDHAPDFVVIDEAHHVAASTWMAVHRWIDQSGGSAGRRPNFVGLSATPARLDGRGLGAFFQSMVRGPSVAWLIERGFLSTYRAFAPAAPSLTGIHPRAGDYARGELAAVMDTDQIAGNIVGTYKEHAHGKRAIYFAVSVEHSKHIAAAFCAAGVAARHLDASSSAVERMAAAQDLAEERLRTIVNVDLFGEGFDLSAQIGRDVPIECIGDCAPTQSLSKFMQRFGRLLRPKLEPGIYLDHAGNCMRHGLPDDEREWTLEGREGGKRVGGYVPAVCRCSNCYAVFPPRATCPYCSSVVPNRPREITEVAVDMAEVQADVLRAMRKGEQRQAASKGWIVKVGDRWEVRWRDETGMRQEKEFTDEAAANSFAKHMALEELIALGKQRGYRSPERWAQHLLDARQAKQAPPARPDLRASLRASVGSV